jgi:hypothetical protein
VGSEVRGGRGLDGRDGVDRFCNRISGFAITTHTGQRRIPDSHVQSKACDTHVLDWDPTWDPMHLDHPLGPTPARRLSSPSLAPNLIPPMEEHPWVLLEVVQLQSFDVRSRKSLLDVVERQRLMGSTPGETWTCAIREVRGLT